LSQEKESYENTSYDYLKVTQSIHWVIHKAIPRFKEKKRLNLLKRMTQSSGRTCGNRNIVSILFGKYNLYQSDFHWNRLSLQRKEVNLALWRNGYSALDF
jgi:hypothetical protein